MNTPDTPVSLPSAEAELRALRQAVVGLGAAFAAVTMMMTGLVWYQTRQVSGLYRARRAQLDQLQGQVQKLSAVAGELWQLSAGRADWQAIFRAHGIEVRPAPGGLPAQR